MAQKKLKKDFDKEKMYQKIMPSVSSDLSDKPELHAEPPQPQEEAGRPPAAEQPQPPAPLYTLRNFMEDMVLERLVHSIQMLRGCECERCKKDVMAIALNALPPAYKTVPHQSVDEAVSALRGQYEIKVAAALIKAIQAVKQNPRHDR